MKFTHSLDFSILFWSPFVEESRPLQMYRVRGIFKRNPFGKFAFLPGVCWEYQYHSCGAGARR